MSDCSLFPEWLLSRAVDDDRFACAYEACSNAQRGWLKKCISLHFALYGEFPVRQLCHVDYPRLGVRAGRLQRPVDWCVLLLDGAVISPVRALAAVLPVLLAGVPELLVARLEPDASEKNCEWPAGLLVGLEMAGVRRMVDLSVQEAKDLCAILVKSGHSGRILVLGDFPGDGMVDGLLSVCHRAGDVRCWQGQRPQIDVWRFPTEPMAESGMTLADVLEWAHPDVVPEFHTGNALGTESGKTYDALLISDPQLEEAQKSAGLVLGPGVEGCWFWSYLTLDFFLRRTLCFSSTALPECE